MIIITHFLGVIKNRERESERERERTDVRRASSVVCHQHLVLYDIFSKSTRALIFGMKHCLVDL